MDFEDFENFLQLKRQDANIWDSQSIKSIQSNGQAQPSGEQSNLPNDPLIKTVPSLCARIEDLYEEKKGSWKAKTIVFTCFSKTALDDPEQWLKDLQKNCTWVLGQTEKCSKTGRVHIQGMANSGKEASRWGFLKGQDTWKASCKDPEASIKYCSKSNTQLDGPWEFGTRPTFGQKGKSQLASVKRQEETHKILTTRVEDLVKEGEISWKDYEKAKKFKQSFMANEKANAQISQPIDHGMPHEWIYGPTGTGKTTMAREQNPDHYLKDKNKWWDDYYGQDNVIIEDLGKKDAEWIGDRLKIWADKWPFKAEFKNGTMDSIRPKKIIVTSNYHIRDLWEDAMVYEPLERRFNLIFKN